MFKEGDFTTKPKHYTVSDGKLIFYKLLKELKIERSNFLKTSAVSGMQILHDF